MRKGEKSRRKLWALGLVQLKLRDLLTGKPLEDNATSRTEIVAQK